MKSPVELFNPEDDAVSAAFGPAVLGKLSSVEKRQFHSNPKEKDNAKECLDHTALIFTMAVKISLQLASAICIVNFQILLVFKSTEEPEINCQHSLESERITENIYFSFIDSCQSLDCVDHTNCEKLKEMEIARPCDLF